MNEKELKEKLTALRAKLADLYAEAVEDYNKDKPMEYNSNYYLGRLKVLETALKGIDEITGYVDPTI